MFSSIFPQTLVLGVVAEYRLPLHTASVIMDRARQLDKDPKSLNHLKLDRTMSSYKMRFGRGKTFQDDTLNAIRSTPFSLNIDESTSNSNKLLHIRGKAILLSILPHWK